MKKLLALILIVSMCLCLAACGGEKKLAAEEQAAVDKVVGLWSQSGGRTLTVSGDGSIQVDGKTYKPEWQYKAERIRAKNDDIRINFYLEEDFADVYIKKADTDLNYLRGDITKHLASIIGTWTYATGDTVEVLEDGKIVWNGEEYLFEYDIEEEDEYIHAVDHNSELRFHFYIDEYPSLSLRLEKDNYKEYIKGSAQEQIAPFVGRWYSETHEPIELTENGTLIYEGQEVVPVYVFSYSGNVFSAVTDAPELEIAAYSDNWKWIEIIDTSKGVYHQFTQEPIAAQPESAEPENNGLNYKEVEITLDNWQEYFEIKPCAYIRKNAFNEIDTIFPEYNFQFKPEYKDAVKDFQIAVEYRNNRQEKLGYYVYDVASGELTITTTSDECYYQNAEPYTSTGSMDQRTNSSGITLANVRITDYLESNGAQSVIKKVDIEWNEDKTTATCKCLSIDSDGLDILRIQGTISIPQ